MPLIASVGTYLPCWGTAEKRVPGDDEDAITLAVEAGRAAIAAGFGVEHVVLVSRDLPLLEGGNAAVLLAGLGLDSELEVTERLGGAPATLDALGSARPRTLVIGVDLDPAGAAAAVTGERGLQVRTVARVARSLPVRARYATGVVHDYGDPRLLRERGLLGSLAASWLDTPVAVAGVDHEQAADLCVGTPPPLPTLGASSGLFALAAMVDAGQAGPLVGVEQGSLSAVTVAAGLVPVHRHEPEPRGKPWPRSCPAPTSRSPWPPTSAPSRRKCAGPPVGTPTPTNWISRPDIGSTTTVRCAPTTPWCRCPGPPSSTRR